MIENRVRAKERSPEKAGVGGSTPSLATMFPKNVDHTPVGPLPTPLSGRFGRLRERESLRAFLRTAAMRSPTGVRVELEDEFDATMQKQYLPSFGLDHE